MLISLILFLYRLASIKAIQTFWHDYKNDFFFVDLGYNNIPFKLQYKVYVSIFIIYQVHVYFAGCFFLSNCIISCDCVALLPVAVWVLNVLILWIFTFRECDIMFIQCKIFPLAVSSVIQRCRACDIMLIQCKIFPFAVLSGIQRCIILALVNM